MLTIMLSRLCDQRKSEGSLYFGGWAIDQYGDYSITVHRRNGRHRVNPTQYDNKASNDDPAAPGEYPN